MNISRIASKIYHTAKGCDSHYIEGYKYRYIVEHVDKHGAQHVDWINIHHGVIGIL